MLVMQTLIFFNCVDDTFRLEESNYAVIALYRLCGDYGLDLGLRGGIAAFFDPISFAVVLWEDWHSPWLKGA